MLPAGTRLGPYEIVGQLGAGGMGEVYKARDVRLNRSVAIKIVPPGVATPDRVERFEHEARAASALNHPNILTIHDVGTEAGTAWIAMELVEGETLRQVIDAGRIPVPRVIQISQQIADGLAKAHAAAIVHRDLKPENVMITNDGFVKIVDFGIAKLAEPADSTAETMTRVHGTSPGMVVGSPGYMSPEQASGRPVDYRSDQFALGLLVYELATGKRPFERQSTAQSMAAIIEAEPAPIDSLNPDVPPHLAAIVARCLAKDPADRYESTKDLARDLRSVTDTGSRRSGVGGWRSEVGGWKSEVGGRTSEVGGRRSEVLGRRGSPAAIAAAITVVVIVGVAVGAWVWRAKNSRGAAAASTELRTSVSAKPLVAVRPFRSLSADPAQGYFAAGVTEEIRGQLSQVSSLRLLSRDALGSPGADGARAVKDLGVTQLVDGSVRVDGKRVRVTAELVDAATQQTLWSDQYDRELADVLAVQSDVAMQIAKALRLNLSPDEQQRLQKRPTNNPEAYDLYLKAAPAQTFDRAKNFAAIDQLRKAMALDPSFAAAQARIGYRLTMMGYFSDESWVDKGIAETETALRIDPASAFAHQTLAMGYGLKGKDTEARVEFRRALELDPNNVTAMYNLSVLESNFGRPGEALVWARRGFPLSGKKGNDFYHVAVPLMTLRADDELRRWLMEGERRFPAFPRIQIVWAGLELYRGELDASVKRMQALVAAEPDNEEVKFLRADIDFQVGSPDLNAALDALAQSASTNIMMVPETIGLRLAYAAQQRGDKGQAEKFLAQAQRIAKEKMDRGDQSPPLRIEMGAAAALNGDHTAALDWLQRAFDAGFRDYGFLERDPILAKIQPSAKVREIIERMKRDVEAQRAVARQSGLLEIESLLAPAK